jgi:tRNA A37 threonylcarbamoyladenosine synthetase subunit TsaC/SUA5/YrdC
LCTLQGVDFVVDGGERLADPSTVIDMTGLKPAVLRLGKVSASLLFAIMPLFRNIVIR